MAPLTRLTGSPGQLVHAGTHTSLVPRHDHIELRLGTKHDVIGPYMGADVRRDQCSCVVTLW